MGRSPSILVGGLRLVAETSGPAGDLGVKSQCGILRSAAPPSRLSVRSQPLHRLPFHAETLLVVQPN